MITAVELRKQLKYFPRLGIFKRNIACSRSPVGAIAGGLSGCGYFQIKIHGKLYKTHRLAWLYQTGIWPRKDVEHKNGNPLDNRWANLRLVANDSLNQANAKRRIDNTSGYKGVFYRKDSKKFRVRIQVKGKRIALGYFENPRTAHAAYVKAAVKYFGEFARAG